MDSYSQATLFDVYAAATIRLAEYARALIEEEEKEWPDYKEIERWEWRLVDLRLGVEKCAVDADPAKRDVMLGYLQETHRLLAAYVDPLLRPLQPPLSPGGNTLADVVLNVNGFDVVVNGFLVGLGKVIVAGMPQYNTDFAPDDKVQSISYAGLDGTLFSLDVPVPLLVGAPLYLRLFVGDMQVGRVDFPDSILGNGFSLRYEGNVYYGVLTQTTDNILTLS